ncbi:hypothetical protein A9Q84_09625 [Halobacteriovorax marinus]|uniref:Uncharacterized protein n=1 Tax=Halobacteriovorax marinus TaxID=97084 RepID=A0A1Y5F6R9_9BACT|nr:hypothetical protein A9Q84_09625 [Halobacteriovorax marinus]
MKQLKLITLVFGLILFPGVGSAVDSEPIFEESVGLYWPSFDLNQIRGIEFNSRLPAQLEEYRSVDELRELIDVCWYRCSFIQEPKFKLLDHIRTIHPEID